MRRSKFKPGTSFYAVRDAARRLLGDPRFLPSRLVHTLGFEGVKPIRLMVDVYLTLDEVIVKLSVPGVDADSIEITVVEDQLTIEGAFRPLVKQVDYIIQERRKGRFARTLTLEVPVDLSRAEAKLEEGVLTLILPKKQQIEDKTLRMSLR